LISATGTVFPFGDSAERFGEWQHHFGRAIVGLAKVFGDGSNADSAKVFVLGGKSSLPKTRKQHLTTSDNIC
jgi:hypothetical protein